MIIETMTAEERNMLDELVRAERRVRELNELVRAERRVRELKAENRKYLAAAEARVRELEDALREIGQGCKAVVRQRIAAVLRGRSAPQG